MDDQTLFAIIFCSAVYLLVGLLLGWLLHRQEAARDLVAMQQSEDADIEPGTMQRPNYRARAVLYPADAMIKRLDEAEMDALIEEMQMRGW